MFIIEGFKKKPIDHVHNVRKRTCTSPYVYCLHIDLNVVEISHKLWFYEYFYGHMGHIWYMVHSRIRKEIFFHQTNNSKPEMKYVWMMERKIKKKTFCCPFHALANPLLSLSTHVWPTTPPHSLASMNAKHFFLSISLTHSLSSLTSALNAYRMDGFDLSLLIISPRFCWNQQKKNVAEKDKKCRPMLLALCSSQAIAIWCWCVFVTSCCSSTLFFSPMNASYQSAYNI